MERQISEVQKGDVWPLVARGWRSATGRGGSVGLAGADFQNGVLHGGKHAEPLANSRNRIPLFNA